MDTWKHFKMPLVWMLCNLLSDSSIIYIYDWYTFTLIWIWCLSMVTWCSVVEFQIFIFCVELGHLELEYNACSKHQDLTMDLQLDPPIAKSKVQFNPISRDSNRPRNLFALEILLGILSYYVLTENFGLQYCRNCPQICPSNWPPRQY
jgi:hypothetical protein